MRRVPILLVGLALAGQASAAPSEQKQREDIGQVQRALTDPVVADTLTRALPALGDALLNMPVGELQAALEGRPATAADRRTTVRDIGRRRDPDFDRRLKADLVGSGETVKAGMNAMAAALPAMLEGIQKAARELDKAAANLPSPTYPKR